MAKVGVKRATELTGVSKSTIQRAMNDGKLSYEVSGKRRVVDVSELERVFGIQSAANENDTGSGEPQSYEFELQKARHALEIDRLEMKIRVLEDQLDVANERIDDLKAQRDQWQKQAQQVLLTSQHAQKQYDDRLAEMKRRDEMRARAVQARREQEEARRRKALTAHNQNKPQNAAQSLFSALFTKKTQAS